MLNETCVTKIAGVFSFLAPLCIFTAIAIGVGLGDVGGPGPFDFGNAEVLAQLRAHAPARVWVDTFALIGPTLALPIGIGWYLVLRATSPLAALGTLLWYLGMVFVIAQDALQLALVARLPELHAAASDQVKPAIEAFGGTMAYAIQVLTTVSVVSYAGFLLLSLVMLRSSSMPRWVGILGLVAAVLIAGTRLLALAFSQLQFLEAGQPIGFVAFMVCIIAIGVVMLRWKGENTPGAA